MVVWTMVYRHSRLNNNNTIKQLYRLVSPQHHSVSFRTVSLFLSLYSTTASASGLSPCSCLRQQRSDLLTWNHPLSPFQPNLHTPAPCQKLLQPSRFQSLLFLSIVNLFVFLQLLLRHRGIVTDIQFLLVLTFTIDNENIKWLFHLFINMCLFCWVQVSHSQ